MKQVIIYPGRFQPMLSHHAEVYSQLQSQFPEADIYVGTSDKVEQGKSPFNFKEKQLIAQAHGLDPSKVLLANRPYHKDEYPFDEANTQLIFAVGEKDMDRFPFSNIDPASDLDMMVKDNSKPKYYQKINTYRTDPKPMAERGYITLAPTISTGDEVASASAFRDALKGAPDKESAEAIYTKQFGNFDPKIFQLIYNKIIGQNDMKEELNNLRKLAGLQPLTESFDPQSEPSNADMALDAYDQGGEDALAQHLGMSSEEFDQELNEFGAQHGLHADDDRDEIIQALVSELLENNTVQEGKMKDVIIDAQQMSKEEFDAHYNGDFDRDEILADYPIEEAGDIAEVEANEFEKTIAVNQSVELAGDSIWDKEGTKNPNSIEVKDIVVHAPFDVEDDDNFVEVSVNHNGPWTIYTDTGFEKTISKLVGFKVKFTEQGMQEEGVASLEGDKDDTAVAEDIARMRHLSGLEEAEMPDFAAGERPRDSKERAAYRNWKKDGAAGQKDDKDAPITISPKDRKDAEGRPERAAAANPATVGFNTVKPEDMKTDGKSIPSSQRAKSIANQFPEDADLNDVATKKEVFLKFSAKRPDLMFGEINARLANDELGLAASDRLSPIVRKLEDSRNLLELEPDEKSFALKLLQNAITNMELVRATDIDKQIEVEPMQLDTDDDEFDYDDDAMAPVLDDTDDELTDSLDLSSIRNDYNVKEEDEAATHYDLEQAYFRIYQMTDEMGDEALEQMNEYAPRFSDALERAEGDIEDIPAEEIPTYMDELDNAAFEMGAPELESVQETDVSEDEAPSHYDLEQAYNRIYQMTDEMGDEALEQMNHYAPKFSDALERADGDIDDIPAEEIPTYMAELDNAAFEMGAPEFVPFEAVEEGKLPAGLQAYQDKKNGKKDDADKDEDEEVDEDKDEDKDEVAEALNDMRKAAGIEIVEGAKIDCPCCKGGKDSCSHGKDVCGTCDGTGKVDEAYESKKKVSDMTPEEKAANDKKREEYNEYQKSKRNESVVEEVVVGQALTDAIAQLKQLAGI